MSLVVLIADNDDRYRRLASDHVNPDGTVNSNAYQRGGQPDRSVSVELARLTTLERSIGLAPRPGFGLGTLVALVPRSHDLDVRHDPLSENDAHSLIEGENTRQKCRLLGEATTIHTLP